MKTFTGGCLCRKITWRVEGELRPVVACHCTQCRKTSGHYVAATQARTSKLRIFGDVSWYRSSEYARRGFCGICGSQLFWQPFGQPGDRAVTSIFAGSVDGETGLRMDAQIHVDAKGDYYDLPPVKIRQPRKIASKTGGEDSANG